jgi:hypothetical protein
MNTKRLFKILAILLFSSMFFAGCGSKPAASPTPLQTDTARPTQTVQPIPTFTFTLPATKAPTVAPSATLLPLPLLTLQPGDFYFRVDGTPGVIFGRNIAGYQQIHYQTFLDWSQLGGSKFVRIQLDSLGMGYTQDGKVDLNWAILWDQVFNKAEADGIYILPVFSGWFDWNDGSNPNFSYSTWKSNPLNQANGGPVKSPGELFQKGSATQVLWMNWMNALVERWHGRRNILAWEIFSEVNLASFPTEAAGIDFVNTAAALIRAADPGRPVTVSKADIGNWPNFYKDTDIDFTEIHQYPPNLDRVIITEIHNSLTKYGRPVLIGESGLDPDTPDSEAGKLTVAQNAPVGIRHAIWAGVVSGAMNARTLYWEDGFGIYFPSLGLPWLQKYQAIELPAVRFTEGIDFSGFKPLTVATTADVWGAAVGNETGLIGWFRDAGCEPPNWNLKGLIKGQQVTLTVPGSVVNWRVDFYSTQDGTTSLGSAFVTRKGGSITIPLPDFQDDIAFKASGK